MSKRVRGLVAILAGLAALVVLGGKPTSRQLLRPEQ